MADDWDLQAVVRGCTTTTTTTSTSNTTTTTTTTTGAGGATTSTSTSGCGGDVYRRSFGSFEPKQDGGNCLSFQDLFFEPRNIETTAASSSCGGIQELHDLYKPFFPKSSPPVSPQSIPISPLSVLGGLQDLSQQQNQQQLQQKNRQQIFQQPKQQTLSIGGSRTSAGASHNPSPRSKRRKNQMKRVCQVPAEALSSDMWSWRKYGQKPIKGSPYPRGYYRCSTSKGCLARKQVERNRSDPGMFIVTYTAEHNHPMPTHRNSLAGSTRQKPATTQTAGNSDDPNNKHASSSSSSPPVSPSASLSSPAPAPPLEKFEFDSSKDEEIMDDEEDDINAPEMMMMPLDDDFFDGLDELTEKSAGDCFPDHFPQSMQFPWLSNNATTTAAGGG